MSDSIQTPAKLPPVNTSQLLSTMEADGSRHWLKPRLAHGRFLNRRRVVAYGLIALFVLCPIVRMNGLPLMLLDVVHRRFTLFGYTFLPTDTMLLALFVVGVFLTIFFLTAVLGRVWCGWACPQTVYMEFVVRPLERLFDGTAGRGGKAANVAPWRRAVYFACVAIFSALLGNIFLSYFVGVDTLLDWIQQSPLQNPQPFMVMAVTSALAIVNFLYFREQLCLLACPYGRIQSVLLDRNSMIISYDKRRGEPRGALAHQASQEKRGDCIDCRLCVTCCPTGIDIRNGLQMECINCTQCIDACDTVMAKINKPAGLIRFSSQAVIDGEKPHFFRARLLVYPAIILLFAGIIITVLKTSASTDVMLTRNMGNPYSTLTDGTIANGFRISVTNRSAKQLAYGFEIVGELSNRGRVVLDNAPLIVDAGKARRESVLIALPPDVFIHGACDVLLRISDGNGYQRDLSCHLLGPYNSAAINPSKGTQP